MKTGEVEGNQLSFCRLVYADFGLIESLIDFAGRRIRCVFILECDMKLKRFVCILSFWR